MMKRIIGILFMMLLIISCTTTSTAQSLSSNQDFNTKIRRVIVVMNILSYHFERNDTPLYLFYDAAGLGLDNLFQGQHRRDLVVAFCALYGPEAKIAIITNPNTGKLADIVVRIDGGYIVDPKSINMMSKIYATMTSRDDMLLSELPFRQDDINYISRAGWGRSISENDRVEIIGYFERTYSDFWETYNNWMKRNYTIVGYENNRPVFERRL